MSSASHIKLTSILTLCILSLSACGQATQSEPEPELTEALTLGYRFVHERSFRREALLASLVNPQNGYSQLRLERYALQGQGWDELKTWNPPVRPVTLDDVGRFSSDQWSRSEGDFAPAFTPLEWTHEALITAGKRAFEQYPLQLDEPSGSALDDERALARSGHWIDARGHVGGLVRVRLDDGREGFSKTCTTCHASPDDRGELIYGRSQANFNLGLLMYDYYGQSWAQGLTWGPGQVDVTSDAQINPAAMIDLRPIRYQRRLHWAATLFNSLEALAVRVDTLIITSHGQRRRPPREVSFAIAYYLWSLGEPPETKRELSAQELRGREHFNANCAACHHEDGTTGPPVTLEAIGTDPDVGASSERGTGYYRVPSLWLVGDRTQLMHHGQARTLEELLDPERLATIKGHPFGLALTDADRADLIAFVKQIGRP